MVSSISATADEMGHRVENAIIIMAKRPFPGQTKTRLTPFLSPEQAAKLYECFLLDVIEKVSYLTNVTPFIAYSPTTAVSYFQEIAPSIAIIPQKGKSLGDRLNFVMSTCLDMGFKQVAAINSDSPNLPSVNLAIAFEKLSDPATDVVLGPCEDGGYYLIGWKRPYPALVREVEMSTPHVLEDTLNIAERLQLKVAQLPVWYDVDSKDELIKLQVDLQTNPADAPKSNRFLSALAIK